MLLKGVHILDTEQESEKANQHPANHPDDLSSQEKTDGGCYLKRNKYMFKINPTASLM